MSKSTTISAISERICRLSTWLEDEAPYAEFDQRHLDANTPEQAYWHLGYRAALADILALIKHETECTPDISIDCTPAGSGE